jgi:hypothetical protein
MGLATLWAILSQTHLVALLGNIAVQPSQLASTFYFEKTAKRRICDSLPTFSTEKIAVFCET